MRQKCVGKRNVRPEPLSTHTYKVFQSEKSICCCCCCYFCWAGDFTSKIQRFIHKNCMYGNISYLSNLIQNVNKKHTLLNSPDRMWFHLIYLFVENFRIYIHAKFYREVELTAFEEKYWFCCWHLFAEVCVGARAKERNCCCKNIKRSYFWAEIMRKRCQRYRNFYSSGKIFVCTLSKDVKNEKIFAHNISNL